MKWRDKAHIHCCWVPGTSMEAAAARSAGRGVRPKLQAFERAQVHGEVRRRREVSAAIVMLTCKNLLGGMCC